MKRILLLLYFVVGETKAHFGFAPRKEKKSYIFFFVFRDAAPRERKEGGILSFSLPVQLLHFSHANKEGRGKKKKEERRKEKKKEVGGRASLFLVRAASASDLPSFVQSHSQDAAAEPRGARNMRLLLFSLSLSLSLSLSPCGEGGGMKRNLLLLVSPSCTMAPPSLLPPFSSAVTEQKSFSSSSSSSSSWSSIPSPPSVFLFGIGEVKQLQKGRGRGKGREEAVSTLEIGAGGEGRRRGSSFPSSLLLRPTVRPKFVRRRRRHHGLHA